MLKCPKCGESISPTWKSCSACGAYLLVYKRRNYALAIFGIIFILIGLLIPLGPTPTDRLLLYGLGIALIFFGVILELCRTR